MTTRTSRPDDYVQSQESAESRTKSKVELQQGALTAWDPGRMRLQETVEGLRNQGMSAQAIRRSLKLSEADVEALCLTLRPRKPAGAKPARITLSDLSGQDRLNLYQVSIPRIRARNLCMADILAAVAEVTGFGEVMLLGPRQMRSLVHARQLLMHLLRELCPGATTPAIGLFLTRDHTTVLYGLTRAGQLLASDEDFSRKKRQALALLNAWSETAEKTKIKEPRHARCAQ